jgi:membrane protein YqaA with SNARE-associated domain
VRNAAVILPSCFGLSILSGFVPWVSAEVVVVSAAALLGSPLLVLGLVVTATGGQMLGDCLLYWLGMRVGARKATDAGRLARWRRRLHDGGARALGLVFLSSAAGIPPLYLTTVAAGASGMPFPRFIGAASCGLFARFGVLAFCPAIVMRFVR